MNILTQLVERVHEKGVIGTVKIVFAHVRDLSFDLRYGTDTMGWHQLDSLDVVGQNKVHGVMYQPTQAHTLRKVLRKSGLPPEGAFLDLGCGKGRVLILAAESGYRKVLGVEFSEYLCDIARANLERYTQRFSPATEAKAIHGDAAEYAIPDDVSTIFLFNPFDDVVMARVIGHIEASLRRAPRRLYIIYRHPLQRALLDSSAVFEVIGRHSSRNATSWCTVPGSGRSRGPRVRPLAAARVRQSPGAGATV